MIRTACKIDACGSIDTTGDVITSLAFMAGLQFGFSRKLSRLSRRHLIYIKPVAAKEPVAGSVIAVAPLPGARGTAVTPPARQGTHVNPPARRYGRPHRLWDATRRIGSLNALPVWRP
jgi:hypothetical protein